MVVSRSFIVSRSYFSLAFFSLYLVITSSSSFLCFSCSWIISLFVLCGTASRLSLSRSSSACLWSHSDCLWSHSDCLSFSVWAYWDWIASISFFRVCIVSDCVLYSVLSCSSSASRIVFSCLHCSNCSWLCCMVFSYSLSRSSDEFLRWLILVSNSLVFASSSQYFSSRCCLVLFKVSIYSFSCLFTASISSIFEFRCLFDCTNSMFVVSNCFFIVSSDLFWFSIDLFISSIFSRLECFSSSSNFIFASLSFRVCYSCDFSCSSSFTYSVWFCSICDFCVSSRASLDSNFVLSSSRDCSFEVSTLACSSSFVFCSSRNLSFYSDWAFSCSREVSFDSVSCSFYSVSCKFWSDWTFCCLSRVSLVSVSCSFCSNWVLSFSREVSFNSASCSFCSN
jgi:hypothetical protein